MNRTTLVVLTAVLGLPLGASLVAAPAMPVALGADKVSDGTIKSVDSKAMTFVVTGADGKDTTITCTKDTKHWLDGKESTMEAALKAGYKVKVTHHDGKASKVEAWTKK